MRCVNGPACTSWGQLQEVHRQACPTTSSSHDRARRHQRVSRQRPHLQPCAAIEQDMETSPAHLRSLAQNGHGLLDITDATLDVRAGPVPESVPLRKRINRMIKKVGSVLELRVLLEQESLAFDAVNTSHALHKLTKLHTTLCHQLRSAGLLSPDTAQQRSEHVSPCLEVLDNSVRAHIDQFDAWDVSLSLWAYASLDHYDRQLFELLCGRAVALANHMKPIDCANILVAFGKWGHYHPELLNCMPQVLSGHLYEAQPSEISQVLWGFGRLRIPGVPGRQFLLAVCGEVDKQIHRYGSQELATVLWALVKLQLYPGLGFLQKCESVLLQRLRSSSYTNGRMVAAVASSLQHSSNHQQQASLLQGHPQQQHPQHQLNGGLQHHTPAHLPPQNGVAASLYANGVHGRSNGYSSQHSNGWVSLQGNLPLHSSSLHHSSDFQEDTSGEQFKAQHHLMHEPIAQHMSLNSQDVGMALWSFGKLRYKAATLLDELPLTLGATLHQYSVVDLCCLVRGYADARHYHAGVLEAAAPLLAYRLQHLQLPELMSVLTAYATFQHWPRSQPQLFELLAEALEHKMPWFKPRTYALAAKSFGNLQYRPDSFLSGLVQGALAHLPDFKPPELSHLLYGLSYLVSQAPHCRLPGAPPSSALRPNGSAVQPRAVSGVSTGLHPALQPEQMQLFYAAVRQCIRLLDDPEHPFADPKHFNHKVLNSIIHSCLRVGYTPWALIEHAESKGLRVFTPVVHQRKQETEQQANAARSRSSGTAAAVNSSSSASEPSAYRTAAAVADSVDNTAQQYIETPPRAAVTVPGQARRGQHAAPPEEFDTKPCRGRRRSAALTRQRPMLFPDRDQQGTSLQDNAPQLDVSNGSAYSEQDWQLQPGPQRLGLSELGMLGDGIPAAEKAAAATGSMAPDNDDAAGPEVSAWQAGTTPATSSPPTPEAAQASEEHSCKVPCALSTAGTQQDPDGKAMAISMPDDMETMHSNIQLDVIDVSKGPCIPEPAAHMPWAAHRTGSAMTHEYDSHAGSPEPCMPPSGTVDDPQCAQAKSAAADQQVDIKSQHGSSDSPLPDGIHVSELGFSAHAPWPPGQSLPVESSSSVAALAATLGSNKSREGEPAPGDVQPPTPPDSAGLLPEQKKHVLALLDAAKTPPNAPPLPAAHKHAAYAAQQGHRQSQIAVKMLMPLSLHDAMVRPEQLPQLRQQAPRVLKSVKQAQEQAKPSGRGSTSQLGIIVPQADQLVMPSGSLTLEEAMLHNDAVDRHENASPPSSPPAAPPDPTTQPSLAPSFQDISFQDIPRESAGGSSTAYTPSLDFSPIRISTRGDARVPVSARSDVSHGSQKRARAIASPRTGRSSLGGGTAAAAAVTAAGTRLGSAGRIAPLDMKDLTPAGTVVYAGVSDGGAHLGSGGGGGGEQLSTARSINSPRVPDSYVPHGLQGVELHVPVHLVAQGQDQHVQDQPAFIIPPDTYLQQEGGGATNRTQGSAQGHGFGQSAVPPRKAQGSVARPFEERQQAMPRVHAVQRPGEVVKTAGKAARKHTMDAYDVRQFHDQQTANGPLSGMASDLVSTGLQGLVTIKGVTRDHGYSQITKQRKAGPGRINFKSMRLVPTAIHAGGAGLAVAKVKEGLTRRMLAAEQHMFGPPVFTRKYQPPPATPDATQLDGFMLLGAGDDELPEGVVAARLSGRHIHSVEAADLPYFDSLRVLDLSDNQMPGMHVLAPLASLQALSLSLNHLTSVGSWPPYTAFQELVTLDLSYNQLDAEACLGEDSPLALLPNLSELNLSGNRIASLPIPMGAFQALELLKLAGNELTGDALRPLSCLPALALLSLSRNPALQGLVLLPGVDTTTLASREDVLRGCGLDPATAFSRLEALDLSYCSIQYSAAVEPLRVLPRISKILLAGNPIAGQIIHGQRRDEARRARAALLASDGAILPAGALLVAPEDPLMLWHEQPAQGPKPTVAKVLSAGQLITIRDAAGRKEAERAAAMAAVAAVSEEAVGAAFERVDELMEAWQLKTVPEGEEGEDEDGDGEDGGDEGPAEEDHTFLTGVGITEKHKKEKQAAVMVDDRPAWEDVQDPTERLALALGLDPCRLAIYTGRFTNDALGSVNALRFALSQPLVDINEGLASKPPGHLTLTAAARAKRRQRPAKLDPLAMMGTEGISAPPDLRTMKIQTVEGMLNAMRSKLASLETSLAQQLAALPPEHKVVPVDPQPHELAPPSTPGDLAEYDADSEMGSLIAPNSPERPAFEARLSVARLDDAASDMSALPEDVIDAIENSDPSSESDYYPMDDDEPAAAAQPDRLNSPSKGTGLSPIGPPVASPSGRPRQASSPTATSRAGYATPPRNSGRNSPESMTARRLRQSSSRMGSMKPTSGSSKPNSARQGVQRQKSMAAAAATLGYA